MHVSYLSLLATAAIVVSGLRLPAPGNTEYESLALKDRAVRARQTGITNSAVEQQRAAAIKDAFAFAWNGYFTTCKGQDELEPVTNTCTNPRNNWGASAVDALSTALVMESQPIVTDILDYIATIDYTATATEVSLFETTIRYMGGMLSGYDLLKGPLSGLATNASAVDTLLTQSKTLADSLKYAFNTSSGIPSNNLYFTDQTTDGSTTNGLATIGTLCLEWQHLSDLTGDPSYGNLVQKAENYLLTPLPVTNEPFPGLVGTNVNISNGVFLDATGGWNGGDDSFYEYLIKMYVYDSSRYSNYATRWIMAADSTIQYLTSNPTSRPDLTFLASYINTTLVNSSEHLTCFDGGNFLLGGSVLGRQDYIDFGLALVNGCHDLYNSTLTGIGPEAFSWNTTGVDSTNEAFYDANGFYITNPLYDLRPEVIESFYYAYRITGNTMYQDWAWDAFLAINATTRIGQGFSEISDVEAANGGSFENVQESFLFAEVMKYSYLIHAPDSVIQVAANGSKNEFVFNTEAHPFKVVGPLVQYARGIRDVNDEESSSESSIPLASLGKKGSTNRKKAIKVRNPRPVSSRLRSGQPTSANAASHEDPSTPAEPQRVDLTGSDDEPLTRPPAQELATASGNLATGTSAKAAEERSTDPSREHPLTKAINTATTSASVNPATLDNTPLSDDHGAGISQTSSAVVQNSTALHSCD